MDHGPRLEEVRLAAGDGALIRAEVLLGGPPLHGAGEAVAAAGKQVEVAARPPQPQTGLDVHRFVLVAAALEAALAPEAVVVLQKNCNKIVILAAAGFTG